MHYSRYGRTGLNISALTFGAMRIPFSTGDLKPADVDTKEQEAVAVIRRAHELGINHIDTARGYGNSEYLVGKGLQAVGRRHFYITTKIGATTGRDDTRRQIDEALKKMDIDHIDILDAHGINTDEKYDAALGENGCVRGIQDAIRDGVVSFCGCSCHGSDTLMNRIIDTDCFDVISLLYWFSYRRNAGAVARAHERDIGVLILSPTEKSGMVYRPTPALSSVCAPYHPVTMAHRWLLTQPGVTTLAVGAASPAEFDLHLPAVEKPLEADAADTRVFEAFDREYRSRPGTTFCTVCYRCMPCPEQVQIPEILRLRNLGVAFDMTEFGKMRYNLLGSGGDWFPGKKADFCTRCNDCLSQCPEHLAIPDLLAQTHEMLEGRPVKRLWR